MSGADAAASVKVRRRCCNDLLDRPSLGPRNPGRDCRFEGARRVGYETELRKRGSGWEMTLEGRQLKDRGRVSDTRGSLSKQDLRLGRDTQLEAVLIEAEGFGASAPLA